MTSRRDFSRKNDRENVFQEAPPQDPIDHLAEKVINTEFRVAYKFLLKP